MPTQTTITAEEVKRAYKKLGRHVQMAGGDSALHGLEVVTAAFALVLDTYANPNPENPEGMCDDPAAFRQYFADILTTLVVRPADTKGE